MRNPRSYTSALMILCLSACAGTGNPGVPGAQPATSQRAAAGAPYRYYACCGTGSGTYTWTKGSEHCAGSVDYSARTGLDLMKDGKVVVASQADMVVTAQFDSICKNWGAAGILFYFNVTKGTVSVHHGVAVHATVTNGFCLPGSESGSATLIGSVKTAHLFVSKITAHCKDFDYSIRFGKVLIHDIAGQLYYH